MVTFQDDDAAAGEYSCQWYNGEANVLVFFYIFGARLYVLEFKQCCV